MKKRWIIAISVIVALVGLLVLLAFTLFSLREVKVDFRTSRQHLTASETEIVESAEIKLGSSVFFRNKDKYASNIEEKYPYAKVINIETVFPSTLVVHIAEREELYAVAFDGGHYICDNELKILRSDDNFSSSAGGVILLSGIDAPNGLVAGQRIDGTLPALAEAMRENNCLAGEMRSMIKSVNVTNVFDENINASQTALQLEFYSGQTFVICNCDYGLRYKAGLLLEVYAQLYTYIGKEITVGGQIVVLTEQNLSSATIEIRNFYDYREHDENDCYFDIIPGGSGRQ